MRQWLSLIAFFCIAISDADAADLDALMRKVSETQMRLPWFWSPSLEGLPDTPFIYEIRMSRVVSGGGATHAGGLAGWRTIHLERVMLDWGSQLRCLSEDGKQPCSKEWNDELARQHQARDNQTPGERQRIAAAHDERKLRRRRFWSEFRDAQRFHQIGPNEIGFRPSAVSRSGLANAIAGELTFDPDTFAITRLEYHVVRESADEHLRVAKGTEFSIELTRLPEGPWVPLRVRIGGKVNNRRRQEEIGYSNYRRFASESQIRFADPEDRPPQ